MEHRITPPKITHLEDNQIFVFGSNVEGIHGAGAALTAMKWGAQYRNGVGPQGRTYAIPSKTTPWVTMTVDEIKVHVDDFITHATNHPEQIFLVTEIGCGLAGWAAEDIAPLFKSAVGVENIHLPNSFWEILNKQ